MMKSIEHLNQLFLENKERELTKISLIDDLAKRPFHILSLKGINVIFFLHKAYVENQMQLSKEYLYRIGMVNSYYHENYKGEIFNVLDTFTYPILSDSSELISRYLKYQETEHPDSFSAFFGKGIQAILNDNNVSLEQNIIGLKKWGKEGWAKQFAGIITVFEGFYAEDKMVIEKGINEIIADHDKQEQPSILKDYLNLEAAAMAKLAWRKGIPVDNISPLIPNELMPIKELPIYIGYEFFKELGTI